MSWHRYKWQITKKNSKWVTLLYFRVKALSVSLILIHSLGPYSINNPNLAMFYYIFFLSFVTSSCQHNKCSEVLPIIKYTHTTSSHQATLWTTFLFFPPSLHCQVSFSQPPFPHRLTMYKKFSLDNHLGLFLFSSSSDSLQQATVNKLFIWPSPMILL